MTTTQLHPITTITVTVSLIRFSLEACSQNSHANLASMLFSYSGYSCFLFLFKFDITNHWKGCLLKFCYAIKCLCRVYSIDMTPWSLWTAVTSGTVKTMKIFWNFRLRVWHFLQNGIQYFVFRLIHSCEIALQSKIFDIFWKKKRLKKASIELWLQKEYSCQPNSYTLRKWLYNESDFDMVLNYDFVAG